MFDRRPGRWRPLALVCAFVVSGCGYVHFGRLPVGAAGEPALRQAYADLALEQKILKQELVLARKESDALRAAVERGAAAGTAVAAPDLARELERTRRELETLRASQTKVEADKARVRDDAESEARLSRLAQENARLQQQLQTARTENAALAEQLKTSLAATERARSEAAQLNTDLLAQKHAKERAEQAAAALRVQLDAVMARAGRAGDTTTSLGASGTAPMLGGTAAGTPTDPLQALQQAKAPPSGSIPVAELRTSLARARPAAPAGKPPLAGSEVAAGANDTAAAPVPTSASAAAGSSANRQEAPPAPASVSDTGGKTYDVQAGDTLEKIAVRVYGAADQWGKIYAANAALLAANQGLKPGMKLQIPP